MAMDVRALTVTELTRGVKARLEGDFPDVWVEGQITNYRGLNASGHRYFSLKDESARLDAVFFKFAAQKGLGFELEEGQQVLAHGRVSVYEPRGSYQLVCDRLELKGVGALQAAFEQLKRRLEAEGLFDEARKRPLPAFPKRVAVLTSMTGAVVQDILTVTGRRCPWLPLVLVPVKVQGEGAKESVAAALQAVGRGEAGPVDVVVLARGGGSLEDLWAFNEELVARAIAGCPIPVISAVGHETDFTIADFVADLRAPTPSAAAEILCPSSDELKARFEGLLGRLRHAAESRLDAARARWEALAHRLGRGNPRARLEQGAQRLDELRQRLVAAARRIQRSREEALRAQAAQLNALSPLAILGRGYAAVFASSGALVKSAQDVRDGERLRIVLGQGELFAVAEVPRTTDPSLGDSLG
jgi:exodeoxyribonuclease VII large subunit